MARRILLLNLLLLALVAVAAYELVSGWQSYEQEKNLAQILERAKAQIGRAEVSAGSSVTEEPPIHDFFVVGERDLFSPDRRPESADAEEVAAPEAPKFPKRPEMMGVSETGGVKKALLTVFDTPKAEGDSRSYGIGDFVQGWAVSDIANTTVTLKWNDQVEVIDMFDADRSGSGARATSGRKVASVNIIRIGSQYAAVETTSPEQENQDQAGDRPGGQNVGRAGQVARPMTGISPRGALGSRRSPAGNRTSRASSPLGATGMVGFPTPPAQATPNPQ